jgi:hypothetical protein
VGSFWGGIEAKKRRDRKREEDELPDVGLKLPIDWKLPILQEQDEESRVKQADHLRLR